MIPAKKNSIIGSLFAFYHKRLIRKHFYAIHLAGKENLDKIDNALPVIMYANHSNWWDGFMAYYLTNRVMKKDDYLMMDIKQMKKYFFFKYIGVFSVNREVPAEAIRSINYASDLLKDSKKYLWIFPQGDMTPQDRRPLKFFSGITKIADKTDRVNLIPVCFRYEYMMEQRPEVFISIGKPRLYTGKTHSDLTEHLRSNLESQLDKLRDDITAGNLEDFKTIFRGKDSRNKSFD
ncbi:MAG: lysophospholipid acyltransferase family protein [Ignavibacteria bacterium]|nr:lysophospholipid acyltransferase family protein [Ignavibacteria bacterium]